VSLTSKTVAGVQWNFASQAVQQVTQMLTMLILARLLMPSDFGLLGMAMVVIGFANLFKDLGFSAAIIQSKEYSDELLSSVFWVNLTLGVGCAVLLVILAPLAAVYYKEPRVVPVMRVLALNFIISGTSILHQALFERKMRFGALAGSEITGVLCGAIVGITLASKGVGVWALVAQSLTTTVVLSTGLWLNSDWRPRTRFVLTEMRRIANYSLNLTGFNTFNYFARNSDNLLVGRYLGSGALGIYAVAYRIMLYPMQSITVVITRVIFPACAQIQDDNERFRAAYLRMVRTIALITFPMMTGLLVVADPFVISFFGPKWQSLAIIIKVLAPIGMLQSVEATVGTIYQAKGRTGTLFVWGICSSIFYLICFILGLKWGLLGVAVAYAIATVLLTVPSLFISFRFIELNIADFAHALFRPVVASLLMALVVTTASFLLKELSPIAALQSLVVTGVIAYGMATWMVNRNELLEVVALVARRA
jgi:O-antigen/teichoic acid export membrane protein